MNLYDPFTYDNLMIGLTTHFEQQPKARLDALPAIQGPGIYALYYTGSHSAYRRIATGAAPIYVGKAVPPGSRKGDEINVDAPALQRRLSEHAKSIAQATNLDVADFQCRHLAVLPVWIPLAERFLIDHFKPVWNLRLDGFGDHDPGSGRANSERSWWDTMHPGRTWAAKLRAVKTEADAAALVQSHWP